jgi:hypothetical protein
MSSYLHVLAKNSSSRYDEDCIAQVLSLLTEGAQFQSLNCHSIVQHCQ